jgi:pyrroloquinoline quinone biosynthesis protein B
VRAVARTQESVAVSADGASWFVINVSPEVRAQIENFPPLHPRGMRETPIQGIVLTNGDLDHCLGLLSLRESQRLVVHATARVKDGFSRDNVLYRTLERFPGQVTWRTLVPGVPSPLLGSDGASSGLEICAFAAPGKPPLHLRDVDPAPEDNVGLTIRDLRTRGVLAYVSSIARMSPAVEEALKEADAVFFDGTFWSSDELISLGASNRRAEDMAHWPVGGPEGSLATLRGLAARHRILIHVNNTNPLLLEDSPERKIVEDAGLRVAFDGMELSL